MPKYRVVCTFTSVINFVLDLRDLGTKLEKELLNNVSAVARQVVQNLIFPSSFKHFIKSDVFPYNIRVRRKPLYNHLQNQLRWLNNFFHHPPGVVRPATVHILHSGITFV